MTDFLLCTDLESTFGTARLIRMRALARALSRKGHTFVLAARGLHEGIGGLDPAWKFVPVTDDYDGTAFLALARQHRAKMMILDLPQYGVETLAAWHAEYCLAVYDEEQARSLPADLVINPRPDWHPVAPGYGQLVLGGPEYALVEEPADIHVCHLWCKMPTIAIATWLHDPEDLTSRAVHWLSVVDSSLEVTVLVGPEYRYHDVLADVLSTRYANVTVQTDLTDLPRTLLEHRAAIASEGTLLYQLAALGIPTIGLMRDHRPEPISRMLIEKGAALGITTAEAERGGLAPLLDLVLYDERARTQMSAAGRAMIDGCGAERVVQAMEHMLGQCPHRAVA
ncbi:MAG TPA: hypothetical protein VNJ09_08235 [Chthonomonadales bacterium]|nr:hypothetical protein [Chthonomonadales bacterium]